MGVKYHTQMNGSWYDPKEIATLGYDMNNTTHQYIISFPKVWIKGLDQIISKGPGPYNFLAAAIYIFPKSTEKKSPFNMVEMTSPYHLLLNTLPGTNSLTYPCSLLPIYFVWGGCSSPFPNKRATRMVTHKFRCGELTWNFHPPRLGNLPPRRRDSPNFCLFI